MASAVLVTCWWKFLQSLLMNFLPSDGIMTFAAHKTQFLNSQSPALFLSNSHMILATLKMVYIRYTVGDKADACHSGKIHYF